ncbi:MAG TPA: radical SAM protein [Candidatus Polarisedimenticolia bacterium]|nr:radical SAM protein [Candidatus Polarisedimenticolia bacterium]
MSAEPTPGTGNAYAELIARTWNDSLPMTALWEITYACNHKCAFCYNCPERGRRELSGEQIKSGLRKIADLGCVFLVLSGGEPLTRPDFFDIAWAGKRLGFALRIYTNGYLIDEIVARKFAELMPFEVEISFHGASPASMDKLTGVPGSFERVVQGIKNLRRHDLKVNMKAPITKWNQGELREIKSLAESLGCHAQFDPVITPRDDGDTSPLALQADREFLERLWSPDYVDITHEEVPMPRQDHVVEANCGTGRSTIALDPYGNIYPCVQWRRSAGNINDIEDLRALWKESPVLNEVRRIAMEIPKTTLKSCDSGEFCSFCPGVAEVQTGDPRNLYPQVKMTSEVRKARHSEFLSIQTKTPS